MEQQQMKGSISGSEGLTLERLEEIAAKVQAATDGPYEVVDDGEGRHIVRMGTALVNPGFYAPQHVIEWEHGLYPEDGDEGTERQWEEAEATIRLMADAPVDVPDLLAEVHRLRLLMRQAADALDHADLNRARRLLAPT